MDLQEIGLDGVDWIHLVQDRNQWQVLVNDLSSWNFFSSRVLLAFQERLSYAELVMESI
jgi:hypothetical protein